jgi:hypothetical protein
MSPDDLQLLIARAADGSLTPEESAQLLAACQANQAVLAELTKHLATDRLLYGVERDPQGHLTAQEIALRIEQERLATVVRPDFVPRVMETAQRRLVLSALVRWSLAAAAVLLAGLFLWPHWKRDATEPESFSGDGKPTVRVASSRPVAVLKRALDVVWENPAGAPGTGQTLGAGWLRLRSGTAQVEFLSGAWLIVVGPAQLRLDSPSAGFLQGGKASAYVPEVAHGFTLSAPGMEVVDLGTAFGLMVAPGRSPEVHAFEGAISVARAREAGRKLHSGEALRLDRDGFHAITARPADFPNSKELAQQTNTLSKQRAEKWREAMQQLATDPASLACYTFEDEPQWSRTVTNRALQATTESTAALIGAGWTGGRWAGKPGIEFRSRGDRLRFAVPGKHQALTMMAWVRVDSLPNDYNSLLMPSHYAVGVMHWTLERGGELRLTMFNHDYKQLQTGGWEGPVSAQTITDMDFGRWVYLASTYDAKTGQVLHYRDGHKVGEGIFKKKLPAVLNELEFGNWGADPSDPSAAWVKNQPRNPRNFVGRLDELNILARVLAPQEIARLYEIGKP